MTRKLRDCFRAPLIRVLFVAWLLPASLLPAWGFSQADTIRCWQVSYRLPHYNEQEQVDTSVTSARRLYIDGDLMMYEFSYGYYTGVDGRQTSVGTGQEYFIFEKDSLSGNRYDDRSPDQPAPFRVDSLQRWMTPYLTHFGLFSKGIGRLISTVSQSESGLLKETYTDINMEQHPNTDSCFVTYSERLNFLPREMSLSYTRDSLYQKRLCSLKLIVRPRWIPQINRMSGKAEWIWTLEEVHDFNRDNAQSWFSRYRQDAGGARVGRP